MVYKKLNENVHGLSQKASAKQRTPSMAIF